MNDTFRKLIDEAPERLGKIANLWDYSVDYKYPTPATLFLDLIGYSLEEHGELLCKNMPEVIRALGYYELSMIGEALDQYATRPLEAIEFVETLLDAETEES